MAAYNCICGTCTPAVIPASDWIITSVTDRGAGHWYRYRIQGINLNYPTCHPSRRFYWTVRDLSDPRYDLSQVAPTAQEGCSP